ncbi:lactate dehydrogenase B [Zychaea mexicana]|uniref:lactate dehydrogenase B n=1 Tax=Zychaea mexicana TaxID=64656 RepID=UPI0022FF22CE|nr:lactate dehydrogenase B [Zychaea mexicana]KAI9479505.1 lactate dehydrogenase B [Zychaea mexicana]
MLIAIKAREKLPLEKSPTTLSLYSRLFIFYTFFSQLNKQQQQTMGGSSKVAIVGAGSVGATIAYAVMLRDVASEVLMVDVVPDIVRGQVLDLSDANLVSTTKVRGATSEEAGQADVIIITAGAKQKEGESRTQLIDRNYKILNSVIGAMQPIRKEAIMILVANPVDVLTHIAHKLSGLPRNQVLGSGTFLDTSRLRVYLSQKLKVAASSIHAFVLGEHGDSQFIAWESATVAGKPLLSFPEVQAMDRAEVEKMITNKAMEIIKLKGATYYGIGACTASLVEAILLDKSEVRPLSVYVESMGTVLSVPAKLGYNGVEKIFDIPLSKEERGRLEQSAETLKEICSKYQ